MRKKTRIQWFFFLALAFLGAFLFHYYRIERFFTLESFRLNHDRLVHAVETRPVASILVFILVYVVDVILALPTAALLTVIAGYLFGVISGTLFSMIGAVLGACILFVFTRYFFGYALQEKYAHRLHKINDEIHKNGIYYMIILRVLPFVPFFLVNILFGLTKVPTFTFFWTTLVGVFPATVLYAMAGDQLQYITSIADILSFKMLSILTLIALLFAIPLIIRLSRKTR
jgi:uncharacterized membrane protein YdjX (TVP38/TMEM64 family)